jgi:hypothetical protein
MAKHVVLIFAYHYPPENSIGGERPLRFSKYLSRLGYTCRVFTAADQTGREDPNTEFIADPFFTHPGRNLSWQSERVVRKVFLPGAVGTQWSYHAYRAARRYLRTQPGTSVTIFSTFPPLGPHLAAWQLARSENLRWIADFRDPMRNALLSFNPFQQTVDRWLEQIVVRRADAVIANTDRASARWQKMYPSMMEKVHLIWNGFDPEDRVVPLPGSFGDCRVLSHTGELYGGRSATPILESIARLIATKRLPARRVRVRLVGPMESGALPKQEFLDRARDDGWLELIAEKISKLEALQIARSSDSLLLLQPQSTTQVPGKLFEYLQIGRPILAFVPPDSASQWLLQQSGVSYRCVYPGSAPAAIDDALAEFFSLPPMAVAANSWFEEHFNVEKQTRILDAIIRSLCGGQGRGTNP